jgi:hypothetical protein
MDPLTPDIAARNDGSFAAYEALGERLSDLELSNVIDPPWTPAALLVHVAFWDRFVLERWRLAADRGERAPAALDDDLMDRLNDALLPQWLAIPPRAAVAECVAAGDAFRDHLARLDPALVAGVVEEGRERLVDRSLHRGEHLTTIERAFPAR